jgi:hypothetical protein
MLSHYIKLGRLLSLLSVLRDICITLPLSGRQGAFGGTADSLRWPVHSRGLFESLPQLGVHVIALFLSRT